MLGGYPISGPVGTPSQVWEEGVPHPGGYPIPGPGGTLSQVWGGTHPRSQGYPVPGQGLPHPRSGGYPIPGPGGGGYPIQTWDGVPPGQTWDGVPPWPDLGWGIPRARSGMGYPPARPGMGYPPSQTWVGVPPQPGLGWGTPPTSVDRHIDWCQNITFPRTTYAGGNNSVSSNFPTKWGIFFVCDLPRFNVVGILCEKVLWSYPLIYDVMRCFLSLKIVISSFTHWHLIHTCFSSITIIFNLQVLVTYIATFWLIFQKNICIQRVIEDGKGRTVAVSTKPFWLVSKWWQLCHASNRVFHKHTKLAILAILPTFIFLYYIYSFLLYSYQLVLVNVKLDINGYKKITGHGYTYYWSSSFLITKEQLSKQRCNSCTVKSFWNSLTFFAKKLLENTRPRYALTYFTIE